MLADPICGSDEAAAACAAAADGTGAAAHCQTAETRHAARWAVGIVVASSAVWGSVLAHYLYAEHTRRSEKGLHIIGELNLVAQYMDAITVQQGATDHLLHEAHHTPFRTQTNLNLCAPPAPPPPPPLRCIHPPAPCLPPGAGTCRRCRSPSCAS